MKNHWFQTVPSEESKIFSYIRYLTKQSSIPPARHLDGKEESTDLGIASLFNEFFYSIFNSGHSANSPASNSSIDNQAILVDIDITLDDVFSNLSALDVHKAMGVDGIPNRILKNCATALCEPILHLFQQCVDQSYLPEEWRIHKIVPIHKSGDKTNVKNYRPISLLCCTSKVLEKIILNKVYAHVAPNVSLNQFGFLQHRSTIQQLLVFHHTIINTFKTKSQLETIYFDIKKAFDSVDHSNLLSKLSDNGLCGKARLFFVAYLSSRLQCVSINNHHSGLLPVMSGVPQGSILGPLLLLLYINDLPNSIRNSLLLIFADDTKLCMPISNQTDWYLLQQDINSILSWSHDNHHRLHEDKTFHICFHPSKRVPVSSKYFLKDREVISKENGRDLGIFFTSNLSWSDHIDKILSQAYRTLFLLK